MSKEMPFRSIKITLSDEALNRLDKIIKKAAFRSYSSGIEECIRAVSDLIKDIDTMKGEGGTISYTQEDLCQAYIRAAMRLSRFTGYTVRKEFKEKEPSTGA